MTSHYVMVTNKLYLDDRNNDYIVLCKLGSHTISGCRVKGVGPPEAPPVLGSKKKKPGLNRVKETLLCMVKYCYGNYFRRVPNHERMQLICISIAKQHFSVTFPPFRENKNGQNDGTCQFSL